MHLITPADVGAWNWQKLIEIALPKDRIQRVCMKEGKNRKDRKDQEIEIEKRLKDGGGDQGQDPTLMIGN